MKFNPLPLSSNAGATLAALILILLFIGSLAVFSRRPIMIAHAADTSQPVVIAHRGGAALMPENTMEAFQNAIRLGVVRS